MKIIPSVRSELSKLEPGLFASYLQKCSPILSIQGLKLLLLLKIEADIP
jgi:hypothetical protein